MANVFTRTNESTKKPNRNTFDLSFVNNLTLRMGQLVPVFCKEVMDGDSVHINPTFGFNLHPTIFPVQTKMKASLHFFYVRNRALWRGWQDFITKQENLDGDSTPPYMLLRDTNRDMVNTGDIGDYFGIPTVYYKNGFDTLKSVLHNYVPNSNNQYVYGTLMYAVGNPFYSLTTPQNDFGAIDTDKVAYMQRYIDIMFSSEDNYGKYPSNWSYNPNVSDTKQNVSLYYRTDLSPHTYGFEFTKQQLSSIFVSLSNKNTVRPNTSLGVSRNLFVVGKNSHKVYGAFISPKTFTGIVGESLGPTDNYYSYNMTPVFVPSSTDQTQKVIDSLSFTSPEVAETEQLCLIFQYAAYAPGYSAGLADYMPFNYVVDARYGIQNSEREISDLPFISKTIQEDDSEEEQSKLRISTMPFRAYEAIYNSFYRDDRNNPLIIDGKPLYNTYVESDHGGADIRRYQLYNRNWEADAYTTAVQSPQQGIAPLVGVTSTGRMTFQDEDGKTYQMQLTMEDDGTIKGIKSYSSDMPRGTLHAMVDSISSGISINDFRNVNAIQRWLETNMRKGYRYKDVLEAHFGYAPTYSELNIPEFIGGMSRDIEMNRVVQTNQSADPNVSPLGTLAGSASVLGSGKSEISHFCDEHGWIIGIMCVTPVPVYSQQLSKQLCKQELLDYYFPEFGHIGYQPIFNKEIAALQCSDEEGKRLNDVFGYQRPWHEYLASIDEVHGDFRTNMKDFLIQRVFSDVPQLSKEFLIIDSDVAENIFAVRDDSDKIFGQLYFDVKMKRPIPALGIPRLE